MDGVSRGNPALPVAPNAQIENAPRTEGRRATEITPAQRQENNRAQIQDHLDAMFQKYRKPTALPPDASAEDHAKVAEHNRKIDALVASRAELLASEGEDLESVRRTLDNARYLDKVSTSGSSFVAGIPFALVAVAQHLNPNLVEAPAKMLTSLAGTSSPVAEAAAQGLIGSLQAVVADQISTASQNEMNKDSLFLKAPEEKLHDVMVEALKDKEPKQLRQAADGAAEMQTFSARNVLRNGLDTHLSSKANQPDLSPQAQTTATTNAANSKVAMTSIGGVLAGMGTGHLARMREERNDLRDAAQIFARKDAEPKENIADERDWYETYKAAKDTSSKSMLSHGASRVGNAAIGTLSSTLEGVRSLGTARSVLANGGFSAVFSGVSAAQKAATAPISNPLAKAAVDNAINLVGSAAAFGAYGAMGAVGQKIADKAAEWYDKDNHAAPKAAVRDTAVAGATMARDTAVAGATIARDTAVAGASAAVAGAHKVMDGARATGNYALDLGERAARQASELRQRVRPQQNGNDAMEMV